MRGAQILLIEDDPSLCRVMEYNLCEEGYAVDVAASGEEGLAKLAEKDYALVITDIKMAGVSGMEVLAQIKATRPETLVILVTAYGTIEQAVEAMRIGAHDYITKPFEREEFKLVVARALRYRSLEEENLRLRAELVEKFRFENIIGTSPTMQKVFAAIRQVAASDVTVLITGESGTGKELVARAIHYNSPRRRGPFVVVNSAAIPPNLMESELFGHLRGAFTGALRDRKGKFELANGGSIFLDEIGDLTQDLQARILRTLQEREVEPVGGSGPKKVDVRVIAATNKNIEAAVAKGEFREDLYYRLNVFPLRLPPLRERREDIPVLLSHFLSQQTGSKEVRISSAALAILQEYPWPGNVRELENLCAWLAVTKKGDLIAEGDLPDHLKRPLPSRPLVSLPEEGISLEELEREVIVQALEKNNWNQRKTAQFLRIPRHILLYRMSKFGVSPPPAPVSRPGKAGTPEE